MALEVLRTRCELVVAGRRGRQKVYDLPERALGHHASAPPPPDVDRWAVLDRVTAAGGLLAESSGPWWSALSGLRLSGLPGRLVEEGALRRVRVKGASRTYLMAPDFLGEAELPDDGVMRVLAPLDPLIWDRALVKAAFGFDYVWEVYKPASARRFGWYVCPLLHQGRARGPRRGPDRDRDQDEGQACAAAARACGWTACGRSPGAGSILTPCATRSGITPPAATPSWDRSRPQSQRLADVLTGACGKIGLGQEGPPPCCSAARRTCSSRSPQTRGAPTPTKRPC
jgi:hypothetical protein